MRPQTMQENAYLMGWEGRTQRSDVKMLMGIEKMEAYVRLCKHPVTRREGWGRGTQVPVTHD